MNLKQEISLHNVSSRPGGSTLVALVEDSESIVLIDPQSLNKVLVYQIPSFHFGINFRDIEILDQHGQVLLRSKHLLAVLSFASIPNQGTLADK